MARYNEILVGRFNRALQKLTQLKGQAPAPQLAGEIMPVFISDDLNLLENRFLNQIQPYGWGGFIAASAGNSSGWRLRNPINSNVIATVELILLGGVSGAGPATYAVVLQTINTDLPVALSFSNATRDGRTVTTPSLIGSIANATNDAIPATGTIMQTIVGSNVPVQFLQDEHQEIVVAPGRALDVIGATVNVGFDLSVFWRERFLEESERA